MAGRHVLRNTKLWLDAYDFTGIINSLALEESVDLREASALGDAAMVRIAGLRDVVAQYEGYVDLTTLDKVFRDRVGVANSILSTAPDDGTEGAVAYTFRAAEGQYNPKGAVGEMFRFTVSASGDDGAGLIRGTLMHNAARTTSANGTARQLGAVSAAQKLYAALHVTAAAGTTPTLDVTIESDDLVGFASPTTQITFGQKTAIAAEWATPVSGAITDDWWRIAWTIGGAGPSFTFTVIVGIK